MYTMGYRITTSVKSETITYYVTKTWGIDQKTENLYGSLIKVEFTHLLAHNAWRPAILCS